MKLLLLLLVACMQAPLEARHAPPAPASRAPQDPAPGAQAAPSEPAPQLVPSILVDPLYLGAEPPELRSAGVLQIAHRDVPKVLNDVKRSREEAYALALELGERLRRGEPLAALASSYSYAGSARTGGVLGTFGPGMLGKDMDAFLFAAGLGDVSQPLESVQGFNVLVRIDAFAACRQIQRNDKGPEARALLGELARRVRAGEDFAALAREYSQEPVSAARGGISSIFERGPRDQLIKGAAFALAVGELSEPFESPLGLHLVQRIPLEDVPPQLRENNFARVRAILIAHKGTPGALPFHSRSPEEARELASELHARLRAGEDMAALAREFDDDNGGKARAGDLGWVHRRTPALSPLLEPVFFAEPGTLLAPVESSAGWVILKRER